MSKKFGLIDLSQQNWDNLNNESTIDNANITKYDAYVYCALGYVAWTLS